MTPSLARRLESAGTEDLNPAVNVLKVCTTNALQPALFETGVAGHLRGGTSGVTSSYLTIARATQPISPPDDINSWILSDALDPAKPPHSLTSLELSQDRFQAKCKI